MRWVNNSIKLPSLRVTRKHWPPVHGPPYGPGPRTTVQTGPRTPTTDPPFRTSNKKTIRDLTYSFVLFCFLSLLTPSLWWWKDLRTSKTTDNLANLCIRCRPPIASAILFGSFLLVFSDSSQTSKIRHGISPCFHVFRGAKTDFSSQQKKIPKKFQLREDSPIFHFS